MITNSELAKTIGIEAEYFDGNRDRMRYPEFRHRGLLILAYYIRTDLCLKKKNLTERRLERLGIADAAGKRVHTDLPTDMRDGFDRDFGG